MDKSIEKSNYFIENAKIGELFKKYIIINVFLFIIML